MTQAPARAEGPGLQDQETLPVEKLYRVSATDEIDRETGNIIMLSR